MGNRPKNPELWAAHYAKEKARDRARYVAHPSPKLDPEERKRRKRARDRARPLRLEDPVKAAARHRRNYAANPEKYRAVSAAYAKANPEKYRAYASKRRAMLLKASPPWANLAHIAFIYAHCPAGYEVDHIIPLQGKGFGGLHVPANLQYLPASINAGKGNRCVDVSTYAIVPPKYS